MRVTTAFDRLLDLPGTRVAAVTFTATTVSVSVGLRRRRLVCPHCGYSTRVRHDTRPVASLWRHLDLAARRLQVAARLRRLACPTHGVVVEAVPFARPGSKFTRDFEALVGWLATTMDQSALARLVRIDWDTVGRITTRVLGELLDPGRLDDLFVIGVDEVAWRKGQNYLTLVSSHARAQVVWGAQGRGAAALDTFFTELGPERSAAVQAVSMDMSAGYEKSVRRPGHAPQATICFDPYHVVALGTKALDTVRREHWQILRRADPAAAKRFKGARWALLKRPENLTDDQAATVRRFRRAGGAIWRAYTLREALRAIFAPDLDHADIEHLLDRFAAKASRCGLKPFLTLARTIARHREGILAAIQLRVNNARHEGLNRRVRLILTRAYGFHSPGAALALIMLTIGPVTHVLPHEQPGAPP